jgi:hypothetical protein
MRNMSKVLLAPALLAKGAPLAASSAGLVQARERSERPPRSHAQASARSELAEHGEQRLGLDEAEHDATMKSPSEQ